VCDRIEELGRMSGNPYAHYDNQGVPGGVAGAAGTSAYPDSGRPASSPTAGAGRGIWPCGLHEITHCYSIRCFLHLV